MNFLTVLKAIAKEFTVQYTDPLEVFSTDGDVELGDLEVRIRVGGLEGWLFEKPRGVDNLHIMIDSASCYDKLGSCPIRLPMPKSKKELDWLIKAMQWLTTSNGLRFAEHFGTITEYFQKDLDWGDDE